jgi:hypothetical protein
MNARLTTKVLFVLVAVCAGLFFLQGCESYRITSIPAPAVQGVAMLAPLKFNITEVKYTSPTNLQVSGLSPFGVYMISDADIQTNMMATAKKAYPSLFSDAPEAIPLKIAVQHSSSISTCEVANCCASCITLSIIPMQSQDIHEYTVEVRCANDALNSAMQKKDTFTRVDTSWVSFWPTGWIPIPGGAGRRSWGQASATTLGGELMYNACLQAIVDSVKQVKTDDWRTLQK